MESVSRSIQSETRKKKKKGYVVGNKKREREKEFSSWKNKKSGFYSAHFLSVSLIKTNCLILTGQKPVLFLALAPHLSGKKWGKSALAVPWSRWPAPVFGFLAQSAFPALWEVRGTAWRWDSRSDPALVTAPPHHWHSSLGKATPSRADFQIQPHFDFPQEQRWCFHIKASDARFCQLGDDSGKGTLLIVCGRQGTTDHYGDRPAAQAFIMEVRPFFMERLLLKF